MLDFFENLSEIMNKTAETNLEKVKEETKNLEASTLSSNEAELAKKLNASEEFTVDRIEKDQVVLENRQTQEMINIPKDQLPEKISEGDILQKINGKFIIDQEKTQEVAKRIEDKMNRLWK